jgi:hypothetical protein
VRWSRAVPTATTVLILVGAVIAYGQIIPVTHVERARLAQLVVTQPPAGSGLTPKPASAMEVPTSTTSPAGVQSAAKLHPDKTGTYSVVWSAPTATDIGAALQATVLPTIRDATVVQGQEKTVFLGAKSLSSDNYVLKGAFPVPGVPGAGSAVFTSATKGNPPIASVVFRTSRVVVAVYGEQATTAKATSEVSALAKAQYQHLEKVAPGFTLIRTTRSVLGSVAYAAASVLLAAAVCVLIVLFNWWRRRRKSKEEARLEAIRQARERDRRRRAARRLDS